MKTLKYFLVTALLLVFTGTGWAIEWTNADGDQSWSNSNNWAGGVVPNQWAQIAQIDAGLPGPIFDGTTTMIEPGLFGVNIGDSGNGTGTLTVTGGKLIAGTYGTALWSGTGWMVIGFGDATNPNCDGVLNMQDGEIEARWDLMVAAHGGGDGTINMTGGKIWAHRLFVGWGGGIGQINLDSGILAFPFVADAYGNGTLINIYQTGNIDIEKGQIHIVGDFSTQMQQYIDGGFITGYDNTVKPLVDYDNLIPGITVVYVPEPATMILLGLGSALVLHRRKGR